MCSEFAERGMNDGNVGQSRSHEPTGQSEEQQDDGDHG